MTRAHEHLTHPMRAIAKPLADVLPELVDELGSLMAEVHPGYAEFIVQRRDVVLFAGQEAVKVLVYAAQQILLTSQAPALPEGVQDTIFDEVGRIQCREGVSIETLLSAYQLGARIAWRRMSATALRAGLAPEAIAALAEAVFCFVDELSSISAAGYSAEQAESAVARERLREELVEVLLSDRAATSAVRSAAARVGWRIPATAAVILVESHNEVGREMVGRLGDGCLAVRTPTLLGAIVGDPEAPGRRERLRTTLRGSSAVIGHAVELQRLPASARIAATAARLQREGVLSDDPVFVDEHLDAVLVHSDPALLGALREQCLAPLAELPATNRTVLVETLRCWFHTMGDRKLMAAQLHVHPQTVRYRINRLRELFGPALEDPSSRLRLLLAVGWDRPEPGR